MYWILGRGRDQWFQLRWLQKASCESGRMNQIKKKRRGLRKLGGKGVIWASNDHVVCGGHSTVIPEIEPHINVRALFGDHLDYEPQGTLCGHQIPFNCEHM